jgi:hypothetical protein
MTAKRNQVNPNQISQFDIDQVLGSGHALARSQIYAKVNADTPDWKDLSCSLFSVLVEISDSTNIIQRGEERFKQHKPQNLYDYISANTPKIFEIWDKTRIPIVQPKRVESRFDGPRDQDSKRRKEHDIKYTYSMYSYIGGVKYHPEERIEQQAFTSEAQKNYLESTSLTLLASDFAQIAHLMLIIKDELNLARHQNNDQGSLIEGLLNLLILPRVLQLSMRVVGGVESILAKFENIFGSIEIFEASVKTLRDECGKISGAHERLIEIYGHSKVLPSEISQVFGLGSTLKQGSQADSGISKEFMQDKHGELREMIGNLVVLISQNSDEHSRRLESTMGSIRNDLTSAMEESTKALLNVVTNPDTSDTPRNRNLSTKSSLDDRVKSDFDPHFYMPDAAGNQLPRISETCAISKLNELKHEIVRNARSRFGRYQLELSGKVYTRFRIIELYHCIVFEGLSRELIKNSVTDVAAPIAKELFDKMIISRNPSYQDVVDWQITQYGAAINKILGAVVQWAPSLHYDDEEIEF